MIRLGESVFQTGVISPESMAGTIKALKRFHKAVQAHVVDKVGPRRSEIIVGGAEVYAALLGRMGLTGFWYSPLGLRDGMLAQMLGEVDLRGSVHQRLESERWAGVLELCRQYGIDE